MGLIYYGTIYYGTIGTFVGFWEFPGTGTGTDPVPYLWNQYGVRSSLSVNFGIGISRFGTGSVRFLY